MVIGREEWTSLPLVISWFDTATPDGIAVGDPERTTWSAFTEVFAHRREGDKDGANFVPARFTMEADGRHVRRLKANLIARTAIALDVETHKKTGEIPPPLDMAVDRAQALGLACVAYTSHNHKPGDVRYRLVFALSAEIAPELPAPEIMAELLGLSGVLDQSKVGAQSLFYLPSSPDDLLHLHQTVVVTGAPVDAGWMVERASALLAARQAEADRIAADAQAEAAARREAKIAAGFNPDDSLIEKLRSRFDLDSVLIGHGYDKSGKRYRHPNSSSGAYGADIKVIAGIERVFSHNGTDPLHASNLPAWCGGVSAVDAFDVVTILDFGGDRNRAMRDLAERFNFAKAAERKTLAALMFKMIRQQQEQEYIVTASFTLGHELGLSREEICKVSVWVSEQQIKEAA